ncbi:MAG TPA: hypothetical protein VLE74_03110 [Candidatus Saccharimonadales bacterium]|nr:hypothetical protein [Candidatus Saccharimonadales bacterium]
MAFHFFWQSDHYRRLRRRIRIISLLILLLLALIAAVLLAANTIWRHPGQNSPSQSSSKAQTTNYQPYTTFNTPYFTFQADKSWQAVPAESTPNTFVYRGFRNKLVERDLTVYINTLPLNLMLTYVLPAQVIGGQLASGDISRHCSTYLPPDYVAHSRNPAPATVDSVSFTCQTDGTSVTIGTGMRGGSYQITMVRKGGSTAKYFLLYHDLSFTPRPAIFKAIVDTFKAQ